MQNTLRISLEFSFKGEVQRPSAVIDLDKIIGDNGEMADLYHLLAMQSGIDTYSYAFEAMQQSPVYFDEARGLASECLCDGVLDTSLFIEKRKEIRVPELLQGIAARELGIDDLGDEPQIREALIRAYDLGRNH